MKLLRLCKATADCRPGTGSRALPPSCARYRRGCMWPSAPETGVENRPAQSTRCCRRHCHRTQARYCCTSSTASRRSPSLPHIPCVWHLFHLHSDLKQFFYYYSTTVSTFTPAADFSISFYCGFRIVAERARFSCRTDAKAQRERPGAAVAFS